MNRKFTLLFFLMLLATLSFRVSANALPAYYPQSFIDLVDDSSPQLKDEIFKLLTLKHQMNNGGSDTLVSNCGPGKCYEQVKNQTYNEARKYLFGQIYLREEGGEFLLDDVYCGEVYGKSDGVARLKIPNVNKINCEHTWPQSRFSSQFSKEMQKSDLQHLFATNSRANSTRGNNIFAEVNGKTVSSTCIDSISGMAIGGNVRAFQPPPPHRGNVARALFYFSIRYKLPISAIEEGYLRKWHEADPVDQDELARQEIIFSIQKNRNPFIDMPNLVKLIKDF